MARATAGRAPRRHRVTGQAGPKRRVTDQVNPLKAAAPPDKRLVNRIVLILDESRSMASLKYKTIDFANAQIRKVKEAAAESGQVTELSVMCFSSFGTRWLWQNAYHEAVGLLTYQDFCPERGGDTPLFDSVETAVRSLETMPTKPGDDVSYLVMTLTDGQENASRIRPHDFWEVIKSRQGRGNWSFAFMGPRGCRSYLTGFGIPAGNIEEWEQTERELDRVQHLNSAAIGSYYSGRAQGMTATASLYTNLGGLGTKTVQRKLDNVTGDFKRWKVEKGEVQIRDFVESKGFGYQIGAAFYPLTKPEKIQSHKDVVLESKKDGQLYGGQEARDLVGIPSGPGVTVKVNPGNHGDWNLYISSTSTNRKLVRGTQLLYKVR